MLTTIFYYSDTGKIHSFVRGRKYAGISPEMSAIGLKICHLPANAPPPYGQSHLDLSLLSAGYPFSEAQNGTGSTIWYIRRTIPGLGDAVMLEPLVSLLRDQIPSSDQIWMHLQDWIAPIYRAHPGVDRVLTERESFSPSENYAVALDIASKRTCPCAAYEAKHGRDISMNRTEIHVEAASKLLAENLLEKRQISLVYDGRPPRLFLTTQEQRVVENVEADYPGVRVGIQIRTADEWRDYPHMVPLIHFLRRKTDWHLFLIDQSDVPVVPDTVPIEGKPIRDVMCIIAGMTLMICPDSGLAHLCGALGVPLYGIFGPTNPSIRIGGYHDRIRWNSHKCKDGRCWYNPCPNTECLARLKPDRIYRDVRRFISTLA